MLQIDYILGKTNLEHQRLLRQSCLVANITRHWLEAIDLRPGMRVLDVGSGVGDLSLMLARIVGPTGKVVGIDLDGSALEIARQRAAQEGLGRYVSFQVTDFRTHKTSEPYDAVIGRMVLIHQRDPVVSLQSLTRYLGPGGIIGFQEPWSSQMFSEPKMPLFDKLLEWFTSAFKLAGLDSDVGLRLPKIFESAGLPTPELSFEMRIESHPSQEICELGADTVRSLLPMMEKLGIVTAEIAEPDSMAERLYQQAKELGSAIGVMPMVGAWCRKY